MLEEVITKAKEEVEHGIKAAGHFVGIDTGDEGADGTSAPAIEPIAQLKEMAHRHIVDAANELQEALPVFNSVGYSLVNLDVEVGISPKMIPHFMIDHAVSEQEQKEALEKVRGQRIVHMLLQALFRVSHLPKHIETGDLKFQGVEVYLAAVPKIKMLFGTSQSRRI